jgi:molybdenum cofactor cytidylyltransferase
MPNNIAIVLLAAGQSRRFGTNKMLANLNGKPLLTIAIEQLSAVINSDLYLILGPKQPELEKLSTSCRTIICFDAQEGLGHSIACGIKTVLSSKHDYQGVMIALADQVAINTENYNELIRTFLKGHKIVAASYNGIIGAPTIFDPSYSKELINLKGDQGARLLLKKHAADVATVTMADASLDIDTTEDLLGYERLLTSRRSD